MKAVFVTNIFVLSPVNVSQTLPLAPAVSFDHSRQEKVFFLRFWRNLSRFCRLPSRNWRGWRKYSGGASEIPGGAGGASGVSGGVVAATGFISRAKETIANKLDEVIRTAKRQ